jgi:hypothetical protein
MEGYAHQSIPEGHLPQIEADVNDHLIQAHRERYKTIRVAWEMTISYKSTSLQTHVSESGPMLAATKFQLPPTLANHYAISITGLPPQMLAMVLMGRQGGGGGRGRGRDGKGPEAPPADAAPAAPPTPEQQAADAKARQDRLLHSVTLVAKGRDPQTADVVMQTSDKQTLIFGFAKDAFPLAASDKDVEFAMKTGMMTIKAKFEPKEMMYKGALTF